MKHVDLTTSVAKEQQHETCEECGATVFYDGDVLESHDCGEYIVCRDEWLADCYRDDKILLDN